MKTEQTGNLTGVRSYHAGTSLNSFSLGENNLYNIFIFCKIVCFNFFFFFAKYSTLIIMQQKCKNIVGNKILNFHFFG